MWQAEESRGDGPGGCPEPWSDIRRRLDRRLVGAYCAMRFDGRSRECVMRDLGLAADEVETAIRRGAQIYEHDVDDALSWVGLPKAQAESRRRAFGRAFHPENRLAPRAPNGDRLSGFFSPEVPERR